MTHLPVIREKQTRRGSGSRASGLNVEKRKPESVRRTISGLLPNLALEEILSGLHYGTPIPRLALDSALIYQGEEAPGGQ